MHIVAKSSVGPNYMDGWRVDDTILRPFQQYYRSYQDDGQMIMNGCVQWNHVYG